MATYRIAAIVPQSGFLELSALPFQPGEVVEVIVRPLPVKNGQTQSATRVKQGAATRASAIATIQSGKYVKVLNTGDRLAGDEFAMQKQAEQALEERRYY